MDVSKFGVNHKGYDTVIRLCKLAKIATWIAVVLERFCRW